MHITETTMEFYQELNWANLEVPSKEIAGKQKKLSIRLAKLSGVFQNAQDWKNKLSQNLASVKFLRYI